MNNFSLKQTICHHRSELEGSFVNGLRHGFQAELHLMEAIWLARKLRLVYMIEDRN